MCIIFWMDHGIQLTALCLLRKDIAAHDIWRPVLLLVENAHRSQVKRRERGWTNRFNLSNAVVFV